MKNENFFEAEICSEQIFKGKVLDVRKDSVRLPDGNVATREYCRHIGAVCVVPITDEGEIILVRQYRYAQSKVMLEIPAGKLDSDTEDFIEAALRELREETGAIPRTIESIGDFVTSPALLSEVIHMYLARGLEFGDTDPDDDEFVETVKMPLSKALDMVMNGEICDSKTQAAVLKAYFILQKEGQLK